MEYTALDNAEDAAQTKKLIPILGYASRRETNSLAVTQVSMFLSTYASTFCVRPNNNGCLCEMVTDWVFNALFVYDMLAII